MKEDLGFIAKIAKALGQRDPKAALMEVFAQLEALGQTPGGQRCYQQFLAFAGQVQQARHGNDLDSGEWITSPSARPIQLLLEREEQQVGVFSFPGGLGVDTVAGIAPGDYQIKTDTGWLLWEGHLSPGDLLWSIAFPGQPLRMAADTEQAERRHTRQVELLDGSVILRTYAGVESGSLQIEIRPIGA
jgi:hypothetical protein